MEACPVLLALFTHVPQFCFSRAAMNSIQQLRVDLTSASDQPSSNLLVYYKVFPLKKKIIIFPRQNVWTYITQKQSNMSYALFGMCLSELHCWPIRRDQKEGWGAGPGLHPEVCTGCGPALWGTGEKGTASKLIYLFYIYCNHSNKAADLSDLNQIISGLFEFPIHRIPD